MADLPVTENPVFQQTMGQISNQDRASGDTFNPRYQVLLDNDNYLKGEIDRTNRKPIPVTLPASGWSATTPYVQTVAVPGLTAADNPMLVRIIPEGATPEQVKAYNKAFGMVDDGDTADGQATLKCYNKKPTIDMTVGLKGV